MLSRVTMVLSLLAIALPASAAAQSAGDNQYQDPFGNSPGKHHKHHGKHHRHHSRHHRHHSSHHSARKAHHS